MSQKKVTSNSHHLPRWVGTGIKPLSVNESFQGKKTKTMKYRAYERYLLSTLPDYPVPSDGQLKLLVIVNYSSRNSDIDNCLKPFIDVLQKKYGFNDNRIYEIRIKKKIVAVGDEEIVFALLPLEEAEDGKKKH